MNSIKQKTILLVEDEALIIILEKKILEKYGYEVITVNTGEKAIQTVNETPKIDLILMDINLGKGIDGTQAAIIILEKHNIPLIFLSSHAEREVVDKTEGITSYGYIVKDSGETVLLASIKMAFRLFDAHQKLMESEEQYRSLYKNNYSIMILIDPDSADIVDANESACHYYGWSHEEIIKKKITDINTLPETLVRKEMETAKDQTRKYFIFKHRLASGEVRDVEVYSGPIIISGKKLLYSIIHDITDRKKAEETLRESEHKISDMLEFNRKILQTSSVGILTYKKSGQCVSANAAAAKIAGGTVSQLMAQNFHEIPSWKKSGMYQAAIRALDTDIEQLLEARSVTTFGKDIWVSFSFLPFYSADEQHLLVFISDITERKRAEEALRESEMRFRTLIENSNDIFSLVDLKGQILYRSPSASRVLDIPDEEIINTNMLERIWPSDLKDVKHTFNQMLQAPRKSIAFQFRVKDKDDLPRWMEGVGTNLITDPAIRAVVINYRDITERKRAEEVLNYKTMFLETLVDSSIDGILVVDSKGKKILQNQRTIELWKIPQYIVDNDDDEMQVQHVMNFTKNPNQFVERVTYLYDHPDEISFDEVELTDGTVLDRYSAPILDKNGKNYGRIWSFHDITDRKKAENALRESEEKYHNLYRYAVLGIFHSTFDGRFIDMNPALARLLGYNSPEEAVSCITNIAEQIYAEPSLRDAVATSALNAGGMISVENNYCRRDGSLWYGMLHLRIVPDKQGKPSHYEGFIEDITERKLAEENLKKITTLLEQSFEQSPVPMALVSMPDAVIRIANPACREFLGMIDAPLYIGTSLFEFIPTYQDFDLDGKLGALEELPLARALRGEKTINEERRIVRKDGTTRWELVSGAPICNEQGDIIAGYLVMIDITERKLAEDKIENLLAEKELILKEVHHRIKNNMNTISSLLFLHADTLDNNPLAKAVLSDAGSRIQSMMVLYDKLYQSVGFNEMLVMKYLPAMIDQIVKNFPNNESVKIEKHIDEFVLDSKKYLYLD